MFLKAAGTIPRIHAQLAEAGYTKEVHAEGFRLYFKVIGFSPTIETPVEGTAASAFDAIVAWQPKGFLRTRAALRHAHPEVAQFVFDGVVARQGAAALGVMALFLDHCDALENSPERKATRKTDRAALATLEARGITKALRRELRAQLDTATTEAEAGTAPAVPLQDLVQRKEDLYALYLWLQDWTDTARAVVPNRADLLRLGIGKRRSPRKKAVVAAPPAAPATPPTAAVSSDEAQGPDSRAA